MRRSILLLLAVATGTLGPALAASAASPCPRNAPPTAILNNCTFSVPNSVLAKDAVNGPIERVVNSLIKTMVKVQTFADKPVDSKGIKDNSIQLKDISASVRSLFDKPAPAAPPAATPASGGPLGYARVNADGTVDPAASKNIEFVSTSAGIYCLRYTAGTPNVLNLTVDISGADGRKLIIAGTAVKSAIDAGGDCGGATNIEVVTSNSVTQSATPAPFYLVVAA